MEQTPDTIVNTIDKRIGGAPLSQDQIQTFQSAMSEFIATYDSDSPEMEKSLDDISKLLTVTADNYEKLMKEKWFQRAWFTVTGKNKKLMNINKHNLLLVQKGSLLFLQNLAKQNSMLMKSVHFALERVEKLGIQNLKIKNYLIQVIDKYDRALNNIRDMLDTHEGEITMLKSTNNSLVQIVAGSFLLVIAGILLISANKSQLSVILSIVTGLLGLLSLVSGIIFSHKKKSVVIEQQIVNQTSELQLRNREVLSTVSDNLSKFFVKAVMQELIYVPINPFIESYNKLVEIAGDYSKTKMDCNCIANWYDKVFQVEADVRKDTVECISYFVSKYSEIANDVLSSIIKDYLPESSGFQLRCEIDDKRQERFLNNIAGAFNQYLEHFQYLAELKESLVPRYPRYRRFLKEDPVWGGVKAFFKGALIIPMFFDDSDEFLESFGNDMERYLNGWDSIAESIRTSLLPILERYSELYAKECASCFEPLFREFDAHKVELSELNQEILDELENMDRETESESV